ncbi:hypothetical protein EVAR_5117_1 [Eumeta japonica]|uniref:Uncharacterized protein n=1 Tax=Eumeta variegata TaxID=151549 RepID=A0A4C1SUA2_EUMVA|nr:hypothetical protein EVAR_5117_1 [Eumeta japonica]
MKRINHFRISCVERKRAMLSPLTSGEIRARAPARSEEVSENTQLRHRDAQYCTNPAYPVPRAFSRIH